MFFQTSAVAVATGTSTATGLYRLELFVQATAKDTRSRLMLNNVMRDVMRDVTLPVGVLWKAVKKLFAFL